MEGPTRNDQILKVDPNRVAFDSTFHYLPPLSLSTVSVYEERDLKRKCLPVLSFEET